MSGAPSSLDLVVDQRNWVAARAWIGRAGQSDGPLTIAFAPPDSPDSLAALDGDAIGCVRRTLASWIDAQVLDATRAEAANTNVSRVLNDWQRQAADRVPSRERLALPSSDDPLLDDERGLETFLTTWLRLYDEPIIGRWLAMIVGRPDFVAQARSRRSLRLAALWLASGFRDANALNALRNVFGTLDGARAAMLADQAALANSPLAGWFENWQRQLNLAGTTVPDARFEIGHVVHGGSTTSPRVTVVIPSYNHAAFVGTAIRSVLAQSEPNLAVIVIDDHSSDDTVAKAGEVADARVRIVRNDTNLGLGRTLGRALDLVETPFVAVLNSDDLFHARRIERCVEALAHDSRLAVAATGLIPIDALGYVRHQGNTSPVFDGHKIYDWLRWYEESPTPDATPPDILGALLERNFLITSSNLVARTEFLRERRHAWEHLEFCVDWQVFLLAASDGRLAYVPELLLGYRLHGSNTVWFDAARRSRYYLEVNQVASSVLERLFERRGETQERFAAVLRAVAEGLGRNTNVDAAGLVVAGFANRLRSNPRDLDTPDLTSLIASLEQAREERVQIDALRRDFHDDASALYRARSEVAALRRSFNWHEALEDDHRRLDAAYQRLDRDTWRDRENRARSEMLGRNIRRSAVGAFLMDRLGLAGPLLACHRAWLDWRRTPSEDRQ